MSALYAVGVPRLWSATVESHRREVREAILDTAWELVIQRGLLNVTMSQIAEDAGIGRATLYKYFPDVEAILLAWHERQVGGHLAHLMKLRDQHDEPGPRLKVVLHAYARMTYHRERHGSEELGALLHGGTQLSAAQRQLHALLSDLLAEAISSGAIRGDIAARELAVYCEQALSAARRLPSQAAVDRLVSLTMAALRPET